MNHFNFFDKVQKQKKQMNLPVVSGVLCALVLGLLLLSYFSLKTRLNNLNSELNYLTRVETDPAFRLQYQQVDRLNRSLSKAENDYVFLGTCDWLCENGSTVNRELVETVMSCFGRSNKLIKMSVSGSEISLEGLSRDLDSLIEAERNLRACGAFGSVFVSSAKEDAHSDENGEEAVTFSCKLTILKKGTGETK